MRAFFGRKFISKAATNGIAYRLAEYLLSLLVAELRDHLPVDRRDDARFDRPTLQRADLAPLCLWLFENHFDTPVYG